MNFFLVIVCRHKIRVENQPIKAKVIFTILPKEDVGLPVTVRF